MVLPEAAYWPNDLDVMRGKELLEVFKPREDSVTSNLICKACHTVMMVDHPFYEGKLVVCYTKDGADPDATAERFENVPVWPPLMLRVFEHDLEPAVIAANPWAGVPGHNYSGADPVRCH
jgi:hypothetical protein